MLGRSESWSLELLRKQERHTCRLLMGAVCSVRFIALSARLSTIDDTMADGLSKNGGRLWELRAGMTVFRTVSDAGKTFEVTYETLNEK